MKMIPGFYKVGAQMQHKRVILPHCWWLLGNMMILYVIQLWWRSYCHEIKIIQCFLEGVAGA